MVEYSFSPKCWLWFQFLQPIQISLPVVSTRLDTSGVCDGVVFVGKMCRRLSSMKFPTKPPTSSTCLIFRHCRHFIQSIELDAKMPFSYTRQNLILTRLCPPSLPIVLCLRCSGVRKNRNILHLFHWHLIRKNLLHLAFGCAIVVVVVRAKIEYFPFKQQSDSFSSQSVWANNLIWFDFIKFTHHWTYLT